MSTSASRETLYTEIWAEPMTTVAKRYDVSSNYLARICQQLNIPRPSRGYWAQKTAGMTPEIPELPEADPGDDVEWVRGGDPYLRHPPAPHFTPIEKRQSRRGNRPKTHPILLGIREDFEDSKISAHHDDGYLKPRKHNLPALVVSKSLLGAAIKLANQLYLTIEDQGHWVRTAPQNIQYRSPDLEYRDGKARHDAYGETRWQPRPTLAFFGGVAVGLTLFEIAEEVEVQIDSGQYARLSERTAERIRKNESWRIARKHLPNGRLGLHAYSPYGRVAWSKYWRERTRGELEELCFEIASGLERAAAEFEGRYQEETRRIDEEHKKWEAERREAQRKAQEAEREKRLPEQIANWRLARDVRAYVAEVQTLVADADLQLIEGGEGDRELKWALEYAGRIDPISRWRDELEQAKTEIDKHPKCPKCGEHQSPDEAMAAGDDGQPESSA